MSSCSGVRLSKWVVGIVICGLGLVIWPIRFGAVGEGLDPGLKPWETHLEPPEAATISAKFSAESDSFR